MKSIIKRGVPASLFARLVDVRTAWQVRHEFGVDRRRYAKAMLPDDHYVRPGLTGRNLEAQLTKDYHRVEKGLALAEPRQPFGAAVLERIDLLLPTATGGSYVEHATTAREALVEWNGGNSAIGDVSPVRGERHGLEDAEAFFGSRHSVRDFSDRPVDQETLNRAVALAINTPSVCNRQAWHVRFYRRPAVARILSFQNGNAGFRESTPVVALVTVDLQMFAGAGERNQGWIEGGLFSMSFVWALHALGLDTCMLNMSVLNDQADAVRAEVGIAGNELVIMMIAVGYGRDGHRRARSPRRTADEVIRS